MLALETDTDDLGELIQTIVKQHPDSAIVKKVQNLFPVEQESSSFASFVEEFLAREDVVHNVDPDDLRDFKERLLGDLKPIQRACMMAIVELIKDEGIMAKKRLEELERSL
ncbi:MAG: hypothetical protein H7A23_12860 [Leptospiraceae bacterium]|nr:hypothetical protein [Leptospiraceae bacterium]